MNIHSLQNRPEPAMADALAEFETRFTYPLGPGRSFSISHGDDYPRFFRAMGDARCFVAEKEGRVLGVVGVAIRPLIMPDGSERTVAYIGDLKVDPGVRGTLVFLRLAQTALVWGRARADAAYGVVMDGTRTSPASYTGRVGIPPFLGVGKIDVLRFVASAHRSSSETKTWAADSERGVASYRTLSLGRYAAAGGRPCERSRTEPFWLVDPKGRACARLEDTLSAKRLTDSDGNEMLSAHLACFAWNDAGAAAELIHVALWHARSLGFPAMFTSVNERDAQMLDVALGNIEKVIAPATVFGARLRDGPAWNINTSEI